jgi:hypothetical protein
MSLENAEAGKESPNDYANKFVWSALGWDSKQSAADAMRDFAHYFVGPRDVGTDAQITL